LQELSGGESDTFSIYFEGNSTRGVFVSTCDSATKIDTAIELVSYDDGLLAGLTTHPSILLLSERGHMISEFLVDQP
jgi:hypothetical protein